MPGPAEMGTLEDMVWIQRKSSFFLSFFYVFLWLSGFLGGEEKKRAYRKTLTNTEFEFKYDKFEIPDHCRKGNKYSRGYTALNYIQNLYMDLLFSHIYFIL